MHSLKLILLFGLQFYIRQIMSQDVCINPEGYRGLCFNIRKCEPLLLLLRSQTEEAGFFLRSSLCGYEGNDPKVCCPVRYNDYDTPGIPPPPPPPTQRPRPSSRPPPQSPVVQTPPPLTNNGQKKYEPLLPPDCGFSNVTHKRVVGGNDALLGAWPWITVLGYRRSNGDPNPKWLCGGSLITSRHVLTAAHCIYGRNDLFLVRIGDLILDDKVYDQADPQTVPIERATFHPEYSPKTFTNDIGLIKMAWDIEFTDFIRPICLPITREIQSLNLVNRRPFVAGWGSVTFKGPSSAKLQEVQIPIVSLSSCKRAFAPLGKTVIDERVLCAGYAAGGKDACQGDSGGPLMLPTKYTYYAVGVVSYGYKCAEPGYPGVYTKVQHFLDFIIENLN